MSTRSLAVLSLLLGIGLAAPASGLGIVKIKYDAMAAGVTGTVLDRPATVTTATFEIWYIAGSISGPPVGTSLSIRNLHVVASFSGATIAASANGTLSWFGSAGSVPITFLTTSTNGSLAPTTFLAAFGAMAVPAVLNGTVHCTDIAPGACAFAGMSTGTPNVFLNSTGGYANAPNSPFPYGILNHTGLGTIVRWAAIGSLFLDEPLQGAAFSGLIGQEVDRTFVPEPGSTWLLGSSGLLVLVALAALARRRSG